MVLPVEYVMACGVVLNHGSWPFLVIVGDLIGIEMCLHGWYSAFVSST